MKLFMWICIGDGKCSAREPFTSCGRTALVVTFCPQNNIYIIRFINMKLYSWIDISEERIIALDIVVLELFPLT